MTINSDCQNYDLDSIQAYLKCIFFPYRRDVLYMWEQVLHKPAVKPVFHIRILFRHAESGTKEEKSPALLSSNHPPPTQE